MTVASTRSARHPRTTAATRGGHVNAARAPASRPAKPRGATPDIVRILRERIAAQEIPPGSKLRENDLALAFGVPRTRVRDALSVLAQRGLVD